MVECFKSHLNVGDDEDDVFVFFEFDFKTFFACFRFGIVWFNYNLPIVLKDPMSEAWEEKNGIATKNWIEGSSCASVKWKIKYVSSYQYPPTSNCIFNILRKVSTTFIPHYLPLSTLLYFQSIFIYTFWSLQTVFVTNNQILCCFFFFSITNYHFCFL